MLKGTDGRLDSLLQSLAECLGGRHGAGQHDGIHEHAKLLVQHRIMTPCHRRPQPDRIVTGVCPKHHLNDRQPRHERTRVLRRRQLLERPPASWRHVEADPRTDIGSCRRAWPIGGKRHRRGHAVQRRAPVRTARLSARRPQIALLPRDVITVLHGQRWRRGVRVVCGEQIGNELPRRPRVSDEMMLREYQHGSRRTEHEQRHPPERGVHHLDRRGGLANDPRVCGRERVRMMRHVYVHQYHDGVIRDPLSRLAIDEHDRRTEALVSLCGAVDRTANPRLIERAVNHDRRHDVVDSTIRLKLIEEPQPPLFM